MLDQSVLDDLWDFSDPAGSETRFREQLSRHCPDPGEVAELATQLARALGLQGRYGEAAGVLDGVLGTVDPEDSPAVAVRVLLERGRIFNSSQQRAAAVPLFGQAAALAAAHRLDFLRVDALHMLAIAEPELAAHWTGAGLAAVDAASGSTEELGRIARWRVSLWNNLGWALHSAEKYDDALAAFQRALVAAGEYGTDDQEFIARWAVARALRSVDAYDEALGIQEELARQDPEAEYVRLEIAELNKARQM